MRNILRGRHARRPRPLRLSASSEDDEEENNVDLLTAAEISQNATPVEISDDEFLDAEENPLPASYTPPRSLPSEESNQTINIAGIHLDSGRQPGSTSGHVDSGQRATGSPVEEVLRGLGARPRTEWLESCVEMLANSQAGFAHMTTAQQAELCFAHYLYADMNTAGAAALPPDVHKLHATELSETFVLQVDEVVNLCSPLRGRYKETSAGVGRCLKLSMTDGVQRVFGIEYRPIKSLTVLSPAGLKIAVQNVHIRRGLLMLVPEVVEVLGGVVEHLEAARQRLVQEVNKPPRGRHNRRGQEISSLASRARMAAWPPSFSNNVSGANGAVSGQTLEIQSSIPGTTGAVSDVDTHERAPAEQLATSDSGSNRLHTQSLDMSMNLDGIDLVEEIDHPMLQSEEREIPFTYLACLMAKWMAKKDREPVAQGKVKCILTGVKEFQFKDRDKFELLVYVDDGSLISEVLIDHQVVQRMIGHSPREVTTLLASTGQQGVKAIKDTMKHFQVFLKKFEGLMLVEINGESAFPVVLEMNEGCQATDAWLLLGRVKSALENSAPTIGNAYTIEISP